MRIIRFIFPFLFVRNWHTGAHELSRARVVLTLAVLVLLGVALGIAFLLQAPVVYSTTS